MATRTLAFTLGALLVICQHGAVGAVAPGLQGGEAVSTLTAARTAIRGDTRSEMRVDSFTLVGSRTARSRATGMVNPPDPFEIRVLLPDNYARINTGRMAVNWSGFRGDVLIHRLLPTSSDVRVSQSVLQPENVAALLREHRAKFTALVLGMLAETAAPLSLEFAACHRLMRLRASRFAGRRSSARCWMSTRLPACRSVFVTMRTFGFHNLLNSVRTHLHLQGVGA